MPKLRFHGSTWLARGVNASSVFLLEAQNGTESASRGSGSISIDSSDGTAANLSV
ncbi:hypothetical protein [Arthrobacter pigmenti]